MKSLLILGAGGHGRVVAEAASLTGLWQTIAFLDDSVPVATKLEFGAVIGKFEDIDKLASDFTFGLVAIGDNLLRASLAESLVDLGMSLATIYHPSAVVSPFATVYPGAVVLAQANVSIGAIIGAGAIINNGASVDHDCRLGKGVHICPGAQLAGSVIVGDYTLVGVGASVIPGRRIGSNCVIASGAAVVKDVTSNTVVGGVPAKKLV